VPGSDFDRAGLERIGFRGFVPVRDLLGLRPRQWPVPNDAVGVYVAYRDSDAPVSFRRKNPAGQWRGDPTLPLVDLRRRWISESHVVYIGKADRPTPISVNSLRTRVAAYLKFGAGSNARHSGGYPTWQLRDASDLLIAWIAVNPPRTPAGLEGCLLKDHVAKFRALPFANTASGACGP
jgi:hypothetical protein